MSGLFVSCMEPSGDRLAADALRPLLDQTPSLPCFGSAGPRLRSLGVEALVRMETVSVMGLSAVLGRLPQVLQARSRLRKSLHRPPSVALFVDGPSMHLPLAEEARTRGVVTVGLVCPQIWAWKPERAPAIARAYSHLLCLFDFEPPLLQAAFAVHGGSVEHVGHPVTDRLPHANHRIASPTPLFGLAPGSRQQELDRHREAFLETARIVRETLPEARFLMAGPLPSDPPEWLTQADDITAFSPCHAVLTKSGTVTLELAWMGVPQVVAHSVSALTRAAGRLLVRHVDHIALPNVLNRRPVVPEFIGPPVPAALARALLDQRGTEPVPLPSIGPPGATRRITTRLAALLAETQAESATGLLPGVRLPGSA